MASLHSITIGQDIEFKRVLASAGFDAETVRKIIDEPSLAEKMLATLNGTADTGTEFKLQVGYEPFPNQQELRKRFDRVSGLFDGCAFEDHPSCKDADRTPGERTFILKRFGKQMKSEQVIEAAERDRCRVATKEEAIAFAAAFPDLQRKFWIVALGSSALFDGGDRCVPVLGEFDGERRLGGRWFGDEWDVGLRFLLVRK